MNQPLRPSTKFERWTWRLRSPLALVALLIVLAVIALNVPAFSRSAPIFTGRRTPPYRAGSPSEVYIVRQETGMELVDPDDASWDRLSRLVTNQAEDILVVRFVSTVERRGWWYPIFESGEQAIHMAPLRGTQATRPFTQLELERARRIYLTWLAAAGVPELADMLLEHDRSVHRIVPVNVLMDLATVLTLTAIGFSALGMRRYVRVHKAERRLRRGLCGVCRYDLTMIEASAEGTRCPECGALWDASWPAPIRT